MRESARKASMSAMVSCRKAGRVIIQRRRHLFSRRRPERLLYLEGVASHLVGMSHVVGQRVARLARWLQLRSSIIRASARLFSRGR